MILANIKPALPKGPGVYLFYQGEIPLYIGKSKSIRSRILQHFNAGTAKAERYTSHADRLEFVLTAGEFGAEVREARLIKALYPIYNRQLRRLKQVVAVRLLPGKEGYNFPQVLSKSADFDPARLSELFIFPYFSFYQRFLDRLVHEQGLCKIRLGLEKGKRCFLSLLNICSGACIGAQSPEEYNRILLENFRRYYLQAWPFPGQVRIKEKYQDLAEAFTLDNWQIKAIISPGRSVPGIDNKTETSLDEFRIIFRHLQLLYPEKFGA